MKKSTRKKLDLLGGKSHKRRRLLREAKDVIDGEEKWMEDAKDLVEKVLQKRPVDRDGTFLGVGTLMGMLVAMDSKTDVFDKFKGSTSDKALLRLMDRRDELQGAARMMLEMAETVGTLE